MIVSRRSSDRSDAAADADYCMYDKAGADVVARHYAVALGIGGAAWHCRLVREGSR